MVNSVILTGAGAIAMVNTVIPTGAGAIAMVNTVIPTGAGAMAMVNTVIPTGAGAIATAEWRNLLFACGGTIHVGTRALARPCRAKLG